MNKLVVEELFDFLIRDYNFLYMYQEFPNCYGLNLFVQTHSYYNTSGCFTIYIENQKGIDYWYASKFSTERKALCEREVDITSIEPQIWEKHERIFIIKNPLFWCSEYKILHTLSEALKIHLSKGNDLFGIKV